MNAPRCPHCGVKFGRTWHVPLHWLSTSRAGWGIPLATYQSFAFRLFAIFAPVWVPTIVVLMANQSNREPIALAMLLALFIFIPGVYVISNIKKWYGIIRFSISLGYVVAAEVVSYEVLSFWCALLQ